jgi:hypothetical protein
MEGVLLLTQYDSGGGCGRGGVMQKKGPSPDQV